MKKLFVTTVIVKVKRTLEGGSNDYVPLVQFHHDRFVTMVTG
jgi:hypothetical protein